MEQRMIAQFTDDCGCSVTRGDEGQGLTFSRCKLHAQAPALLEALEAIFPAPNAVVDLLDDANDSIITKARDAIEATKGDA